MDVFSLMFLSEKLLYGVESVLSGNNFVRLDVNVVQVVSGRSINKCYKLRRGSDHFFLKVNSVNKFSNMFAVEAEGLKRLRLTQTIRVPQTVAFGVVDHEQFLLLQWIEKGANSKKAQEALGSQLARLHKIHAEEFGLDHDNYMGSLNQKNSTYSNWSDFYIKNRLEPQIEIAQQKRLLNTKMMNAFHSLFKRLDSLYPFEKSSLIHGDLWSGNYLIDSGENPILIDPAIAYGHREVDIAMTTLFGGFDASFYKSYNEEFALEKGWKERLDLWNLYPLLVHLNLFGKGYLEQLETSLKKYI